MVNANPSRAGATPDRPRNFSGFWHRAGVRTGITFAVLLGVTVLSGINGSWAFAPALGWIAASGTFVIWVWLSVIRLGPKDTASHATSEDPTKPVAEALLIFASLASLGAIALLVIESGNVKGGARFALAGAALATVAASWCLVHVVFTLRYAGLYFAAGGSGVDFNQQQPPEYRDFAYLAFTLGMTYQVSDTNITSTPIRREALRHGLLSFLLGVIVVAATVNLIAALAL